MSGRRIDVHQHIVPPAYADWLRSKGDAYGALDADGYAAIDRGNAEALFAQQEES